MAYKSNSFAHLVLYFSKSSTTFYSARYHLFYLLCTYKWELWERTILVHLWALYNIDLEIFTKTHNNDFNDYAYAIKYYAKQRAAG